MSDDLFARVKLLLAQAFDLPESERAAFVRAAGGDDEALVAEALSLLAADADESTGFGSGLGRGVPHDALAAAILASPTPVAAGGTEAGDAVDAPGDAPPGLPRQVGRYRVVRLVAHGGMGAVYEARQDSPRRRVALKMLRADLVTTGMLERFHREGEILGLLHHPGIAQVFEAGTTTVAGLELPFFAMEFVEGRPLTAHADDAQLDTAARLELVARVCDAVEHAHDRGVVHRDLKPDNILVSADGRPKVLDFGVARMTGLGASQAIGRTSTGQMLGTLAYMSPEQVSGDPARVDRRADVYALGVVLFELLSGRRPHHLAGCSVAEAARVLRDDEPTRLGRLVPGLRGEIDTLVGKALEKDPARRYPSAGALAADLRRLLAHRPISAQPPSRLYLARKFVRRHRGLTLGATLAFGSLSVALAVSLAFGREAQRERDAALRSQYVTALRAANAALEGRQFAEARRNLDERTSGFRDAWEWRFLEARTSTHIWEVPLSDLGLRWDVPLPGLAVDEAGDRVVAWRDAASLGVWSADLGEELLRIDLPAPTTPGPLALSGDRLAVTRDGRLELYSLRDGALLSSRPTLPQVTSLDWSGDGARLAVAGSSGDAWQVWCGDPERLELLHSGLEPLPSVVWGPDDLTLACPWSDTPDGPVCLAWDLDGGRSTRLAIPWQGLRNDGIRCANLCDDFRLLVLGDSSRSPWLFDLGDARWPASLPAPRRLQGHRGRELLSLALSADGRRLASSALADSARTWDVSTGACLNVLAIEGAAAVALTRDGRSAFVRDEAGLACLPAEGRPALTLAHDTFVYDVVFSPDGRLLATRDFDGVITLWDALDGERLVHLDPGGFEDVRWARWGLLEFSEDGRELLLHHHRQGGLVAADVAFDTAWREVPSGAEHAVNPDDPVNGFAPVPAAGRWRVRHLRRSGQPGLDLDLVDACLRDSRDVDRPARLWPLEGAVQAVTGGDRIEAYRHGDCAFSPDDRRVLVVRRTVDTPAVTTLHDVASGALLARLAHDERVYAVAWSPDGRRLATGANDNTIRVFDATTCEELLSWRAHDLYVRDLAWSPDGERLASASGDGTARIWDTVGLAQRHRDVVAARRLRQALAPKVDELLLASGGDAAAVAARLRADATLDADARHAALRVLRERVDER